MQNAFISLAPKLSQPQFGLVLRRILHSIGAVASVFSKPYKFFPILCIPSPQIRGDRFEEVNWSIISYYYTVESPYPSMKFLIFWKISKSLSKNSDFTPTVKNSSPREKAPIFMALERGLNASPEANIQPAVIESQI